MNAWFKGRFIHQVNLEIFRKSHHVLLRKQVGTSALSGTSWAISSVRPLIEEMKSIELVFMLIARTFTGSRLSCHNCGLKLINLLLECTSFPSKLPRMEDVTSANSDNSGGIKTHIVVSFSILAYVMKQAGSKRFWHEQVKELVS
eukprot:Gb_03804 [translate_table: standard]